MYKSECFFGESVVIVFVGVVKTYVLWMFRRLWGE